MFKPNNKKRKKLRKLVSIVLIVTLFFIWTMSNLPRVGENEFPPKVRETHAAPIQEVLTSAQGSSWDVPSTWDDTNNSVEVIGGGAGGGGGGSGGSKSPGAGGGGGAYAKTSNIDLDPGGTAIFDIGAGGAGGSGASAGTNGGDTSFNGPTGNCSSQSVCGEGGDGGGAVGGTGGAGGTTGNSIGTVQKYAGGTGADAGASVGGGGGGAAGLYNIGLNGVGSTGGDGDNSSGGAGGTENNPGGDGIEWTETGSGGGGGGGNKANGGAGGAAGAGGGGADNGAIGGSGTEGVIVITYEPLLTTTLTQNDFLIYVDNNVLDPTDIWGNPDIGGGTENSALNALPVSNDPVDPADIVRFRMNITVTEATLAADTEDFILQYKETNDCTDASAWTDVDVAAGGGTWRFTSGTDIADNTALGSDPPGGGELNLTESDVAGRYNRSDPTTTNPFEVLSTPEDFEWDWDIEYNGNAEAHTYCFRMAKNDGGAAALNGYNSDSYPKIDTRPGVGDQMRHGNFFTTGQERGFFWVD